MSLKRPARDLSRRIIPAVILIFAVLFSGTNYVPTVSGHASLSPDLHVTAVTPIPQLRITEWDVPSTLGGPIGVGIDQLGKVWITENATSKLAVFDPSNNNFTEWSTPTNQSQPRNLVVKQVSVSGVSVTQVFFTEYALNAIARFDVGSNTFTEWPLPTGSRPVGIYVDENNDIWFTESGRDVIGRLHTSTNNLTEWTLPGATTIPGSPILKPWGIYVQVVTKPSAATNRFVWFTESSSNAIGRLEANSNRLTLWDLNSLGLGSYQPTDITYGTVTSIPSIIFSDANSNRISILWNDTGGPLSTYRDAIIPTGAAGPSGVTFDSARSAVWFAENNAGNIANLNTTAVLNPTTLTANYCTIPPAVGTPSCLSPAAMTSTLLSPTVTANVAAVSQIQPPTQTSNVGIFQNFNGYAEYNLPNRTAEPNLMALDSSGNLWFTESNVTVNRIGRISVPYVYQVSAFPTTQTVNTGNTATYTVNVALTTGTPIPVQLSLINAPANVTTLFNPQLQKPSFTSTLTITTSSSTPTGTFHMIIQAISGGQTQSAAITLTVQTGPPPAFNYQISLTSPASATIPQGESASFGLAVALLSGSSQSVTLSASGLPAGAIYSFTNSSGLVPFSSTLQIHTTANTPAGSYPITITGVSSGGVQRNSAQTPILVITEVFRDFNLTSSVSQVILVQGSKADVPITVTAVGAFSGDVNFDATFSPPELGLGASFSSSPVTVQPNGTAQTTMEIIAYKDTSGTYQLTITATSSNPSRSHQIVMSVRVSPCLIATATFGSELAPEVQFLRGFRDQQIMQTFAGSSFMEVFNGWYYSFSPAVAQYEYSHATTRAMVKLALYPLMGILHLSSSTYAFVGFEPEAAALVAGLIASSLIGLAYLALPLTGVFWVKGKRINARTRRRVAKWMAIVFAALIAGFVVSELMAIAVVMMVASAGLVLTALLAGSVLPAFKLVESVKRRN